MPDEPQEVVEEEQEEPQGGPSKSKLSLKTLILIGLPLVMVQAVMAYFIVSNYIEPKLPEIKPPPEDKKTQGPKTGEEADLSTYVTFPVEDIIVNPAETAGQRYLSVSVNVYVPEDFKEENMKSIEPEIRGVIIERISRKRLDELDDFKDQQILREEIKDDLNVIIDRYFSSKFPGLNIPRVVFSKYTIQ
jgi:flagellar basal body-associated protein FliL